MKKSLTLLTLLSVMTISVFGGSAPDCLDVLEEMYDCSPSVEDCDEETWIYIMQDWEECELQDL